MNNFTKYCHKMYSGCDNIDCNYAHCEAELRSTDEFARQGVRFTYVPNDTLPRFIIPLQDDSDSDSEEESCEKACENAFLSLSMIDKSNAVFLVKKQHEAFERRMTMMENTLSELLRDISLKDNGCLGECDMDMSE